MMTTETPLSNAALPADAATWPAGSALIFVDAPKRNRQPAHGCFSDD